MQPARPRLAVLSFILTALATSPGCSDNTPSGADARTDISADGTSGSDVTPGDAATDSAVDAPLPPGPAGDVLRVPATGSFTLPTLRAPVQVLHTEADVPHVYASSERDATVVLGFLTARDRYFQMELERRLGLGTLSSLLGDATLPSDQTSRGQGMTYVADRILTVLEPSMLDRLDAYAEGINAYIAAAGVGTAPLPGELRLASIVLGAHSPTDILTPWTRRDVAGILAVVLFNSSFATDDLDRSNVAATFPSLFASAPQQDLRRAGLQQDLFDWVTPVYPVTSAPGWGLSTGTMMAQRREPRLRRREGSTTGTVEAGVLQRAIAALRSRQPGYERGRQVDHGSNAWAVSSLGTADGSALLEGDGHLGLSVPTLLYQAGVDTTVFGNGAQTQLGLYFPGIPVMGLGTNGHVAWSFTYLYGDLTDWYAEEIQLDASGAPMASRYQGSWRPLTATSEAYVIANVPSLMSVGRTENWNRWTTFDGRWITSIEGTPVTAGMTPGAGQTVVELLGQKIIPGDVNHDGRITAVSFDYAGFDVSDVLHGLDDYAHASGVADIRAAQRRFVGFAQNFVSADDTGKIYYSGFTGTPCRRYLPTTSTGWAVGADPRLLLDGTQYGSFQIPLDASGYPVDTAGAPANQCVVPFADWPASMDPDQGYVVTSNNDPVGNSLDDNLSNDRWYIGGSWDPGYRAHTISTELAHEVSTHGATVASMQTLQGDHHSAVGQKFVPFLQSAIADAQAIGAMAGPLTPEQTRVLGYYTADQAAMDEVNARLTAWLTSGANAASGVATFYDTPTADDVRDAIATMVFDAWFRALVGGVYDDEGVWPVLSLDPRFKVLTSMTRLVDGRGPGNTQHLGSFDPATGESAFWDDVTTSVTESSREIALRALARSLAILRAAPSAPGQGGFGTTDMTQWLWGLRHQVQLPSIIAAYAGNVMGVSVFAAMDNITTMLDPLAPGLTSTDPRSALEWFPRPGDIVNVDAANPPFTGTDWTYATGPVMRMVISLHHGTVTGQNIIPGGQSGISGTPHFDDQARQWLGNHALPMRFAVADVIAGATGRETFTP